MTTTICLSKVKSVKYHSSCLQGPCLHGVQIKVSGRPEPICARNVLGQDIMRMLEVKGRRKTEHFNWFLTQSGWSTSTQSKHMNKEPITIESFVFTYPEKYTPKQMQCVVITPKPPKPLSKSDMPSEAGRRYCAKHGMDVGLVSMNYAKAIVRSYYGHMV